MPAVPSSRHIVGPSEFASHWPLSGHIEGPSKPAGIQYDGFPKVADRDLLKSGKMDRLRTLVTTVSLALALLFPQATFAQSAKRLNIVFVFMDNFGWGELGTYGGGILMSISTRCIARALIPWQITGPRV